jgi:hypothetical protein
MKRSILISVLFAFIATIAMAQPQMARPQMLRPFIDFSKYEKVDTLPLEMISVHFPTEIENENIAKNGVSLGGGDYMFPTRHSDNIIIKTNADRTKAIVVFKSIVVGGRFELPIGGRYEYTIEENDRRLILYYKDNRTYCGYIYDKKFKICQCFEEKKAYRRFMRKFDI